MATVFLGRQPIFDRQKNVFGYELLHRSSGTVNAYTHVDGDVASTDVIRHSLNTLPLAQIVGDRQAFINITRKLLVEQTYSLLPNNRAVVELLESVEADDEVLAACRTLKKADYILALDDFADTSECRPLLDYADLLKIDFLVSDQARRQYFADKYFRSRVQLLAEKVETQADFDEAFQLGYSYFQGYFFCKPEIISGREVPSYKQNYLMFIQELNRSPMNFTRLEQIIKSELSLTTKLLRYLNSAAIGLRFRLASIQRALALLGEGPLRKWASLAAISALGEDKPQELLATSLIRARFCELLAPKVGLANRVLDAFLLGLFSTMDALMDQPLAEVIATIPVTPEVSSALMGEDTPLGRILKLILAIERGNATVAEPLAKGMNLSMAEASVLYTQSLRWADDGIQEALAA